MAETIKGINVVIGAETTGLSAALSDVNKKSRDIQSELKQVEKLLKLDPTNTELLAQKQKLLGDAISNTKEKLDRIRAAQEQVNQQFAAGKINEGQYRAFQREIAKTEQELRSLESRLEKTGAATKSFGDRLQNASGTLTGIGTALTAAGTAIAAGLGSAVKTTADFDAQMSKVQALADATTEQFQQMREQAIKLGADTSFSASQAAEAMQMLAAGGMDANKIMAAMPGVLAAAAASGEEMSLVAETMSSALNAFKMEASQAGHVADVLAKAANQSAINVQDMAYSLKYAGPVAAQLGISLEEVAAAVVEMGNAGIKGEQAGTTLRAAFLRLVDPPKEAREQLQKLGVAITDAQGKMLPLGDIIGQLNKSMAGMTDAQKAAALSTIFGTEAVSGMMVIVGQGKDAFDRYAEGLRNADGAAQKAADIMKNNLKGSMDELKGSLESAAIAIGTALVPALRVIGEVVKTAVDAFLALPKPIQETIAISAAVASAIALIAGPVLLLVGFIPQITAGFAALSGVFAGMAAPIAAVVAAIALIGAAIYDLWNTNEEFRGNLIAAWNDISSSLSGIMDQIKAVLGAVWPYLAQSIGAVWEQIKTVVKFGVEVIANTIGLVLNIIEGDWAGAWENAKNIGQAAWDFIVDSLKNFGDSASKIWSAISDTAEKVWSGIKDFLKKFGEEIMLMSVGPAGWAVVLAQKLGVNWNTVKSAAENVWNAIRNSLSWVWGSIASTASSVWERVKNAIISPIEEARMILGNIINAIENAFSGMRISIPRPKLPHISVNVRYTSVGGIDVPYPDFDIDWYAKGGIFTGPSIIGVGEAGTEAVVPLDRLPGLISDALADAMPAQTIGGGNIVVQNMIVRNDSDIQKIARELFTLQQRAARARGM